MSLAIVQVSNQRRFICNIINFVTHDDITFGHWLNIVEHS